MNRYVSRRSLAFFVLAILGTAPSQAAPIIAGTTYLPGTAIQTVTLLPNTFLNMTPNPIVIPGLSGVGSITLNRDAEDPTTNSIAIPTLAGGLYYGSEPGLGNYVFGNIPPLTGADFSGSITNVQQNTSDPGYATGQPSSFASGDFSFGGNSFGFEFLSPGPLMGLKLFTDPTTPFSFSSTFDGLPPSAGTTLINSGTDSLNILYTDPSTGMTTVVGTSSDRIIVLSSVPEPSSFVLLAAGGLGLCGFCRRCKVRGGLPISH